jgi:hypothetical protein
LATPHRPQRPAAQPSTPDTTIGQPLPRRESTTVYVVQYQPDDGPWWFDKADGTHPTLAAARRYTSSDDIAPLRIVRRTETVVETLPDPRADEPA